MEKPESVDGKEEGFITSLINEIIYSPLNVILILAIATIIYKMVRSNDGNDNTPPADPPLPPMKKKDFTLEELKTYNGSGPDGRILIAVNGKVFDVTKGKRFYGKDGPYYVCAGKDASRGLATFKLDAMKDEYDDLSDLKPHEMDQVKEWEEQFTERYIYVGRLLKPGEQPNEYSDASDHEERETEAAKM